VTSIKRVSIRRILRDYKDTGQPVPQSLLDQLPPPLDLAEGFRRLLLALALIAATGACLFPPWQFSCAFEGQAPIHRPAPFQFLFHPPPPDGRPFHTLRSGVSTDQHIGVTIDLPRLVTCLIPPLAMLLAINRRTK